MTRRHIAKARDAGNASIILVLITPALFAVAGLVVDGGRAINARQRAADQAEQAARAAADALDVDAVRAGAALVLDPLAARAAAERYLAASGATGSVALRQGTVSVTVTGTTSTVFFAVIGINQINVTGTATARPARGIVSEERP
ncbi:MAG: pilus assembly protein TadG-related protein [Mycobacteriales bacterium]